MFFDGNTRITPELHCGSIRTEISVNVTTQKIRLEMEGMEMNEESATLRQIAANSALQIRVFQASLRRERRFFMGCWQIVQGEQQIISL